VGYVSSGASGESVDSYPLTLIVETGLLGLIAFSAILGIVMWRGVNLYLRNSNPASTKAIAVVSTFVAFLVQRMALSQTENFINIFMLLGFFIALEKFCLQRVKSDVTINNSIIDVPEVTR
jgi:O-antigen ligase